MAKKIANKAYMIYELGQKLAIVKAIGMSPLLMGKVLRDVAIKIEEIKGGKVSTEDLERKTEEMKLPYKIHHTEDGRVGFPSAGFMSGMVAVANQIGLEKKTTKGAFKILGRILPITYEVQLVNEAIGKYPSGAPKLILRPEFQGWSCELPILYDETVISLEHILNLVNRAGFYRGVGEWRPGSPKSDTPGTYGMYYASKNIQTIDNIPTYISKMQSKTKKRKKGKK